MSTNTETPPVRIEVTTPGCKQKFADWITGRGGVLIWTSQLIGDTAGQTFTPARSADGNSDTPEPGWKFKGGTPELVTDIARFRFAGESKEMKRVKIAVKRGDGLRLDLTDASAKRLRAACDKVQADNGGVAPTYHFEGNEAVIVLPIFEE